jgi:O-acetyl-ADP-ribose deacetylase (regulator of RNase III)
MVNVFLEEIVLSTDQTLQLVEVDNTTEMIDAIVNAANACLKHRAGVVGAILRRGGPAIRQESDSWVLAHGPVSHAAPTCTLGGNLSRRYFIHAEGQGWGEGDEDARLAAAISGSLRVAKS